MYTNGLWFATSQCLVLPRKRRMREDDPQLGEVHGDVVDEHGIGVLQPDTAATRHPGTDARLSTMERAGNAGFLDQLVQRVSHPVIGHETLDAGVELESAYPVVLDQPTGSRTPASPRDGSTLANGISTSACSAHSWAISRCGSADDRSRFRVDGEHHRRHVPFPVVRGDSAMVGWRLPCAPKYAAEAASSSGASEVCPSAGDLRVGVHVDGHPNCPRPVSRS